VQIELCSLGSYIAWLALQISLLVEGRC